MTFAEHGFKTKNDDLKEEITVLEAHGFEAMVQEWDMAEDIVTNGNRSETMSE